MKRTKKQSTAQIDRAEALVFGIEDKYLEEGLLLHRNITDGPKRAASPAIFTKRVAVIAACVLIAVALVPLAFIISETLDKAGDSFAPSNPEDSGVTDDLEDSPICLISYAGWTGNIAEGALNLDKLSVSGVQHLPIYKVESVAELDAFKQGWSLNFDQDCSEAPSFNSVTSAYSDEFFAENTLLVIYVSSTSGSYRYGVWDVYIEGGELCVHVERTNDKGPASEDMSGWFITIEIPDKMLEGVTSFDADLNNFK